MPYHVKNGPVIKMAASLDLTSWAYVMSDETSAEGWGYCNVSITPGKRPVLLLCCEFLDEFMFDSFSITGNWDSMEEYTCMIPRETQEGAFYRAALALHQNHFQQAQAVSVSWDRHIWSPVLQQRKSERSSVIMHKPFTNRCLIIVFCSVSTLHVMCWIQN